MSRFIQQKLTLSIPLTLTGHHAAQLFYQRHADPHKAKRVYVNTLVVEAVHTYLGWLGIVSDLQASDSWDPIIQTLADVADLEIPGQGKLECRPVLPGDTTCYIPPEAHDNRIGYLPVHLDTELKTATLLGFVPSANISVETEEVPLTHLQSIASLFDYLRPQSNLSEKGVDLGQWLRGTVTSGWQTVEELFRPQPVFNFRGLKLSDPADASEAVVRGKLIKLAPPASYHQSELQINELYAADAYARRHQVCSQIVLIVGIMPSNVLQHNIWVKLCPTSDRFNLPEDLEIRVLDSQESVVMEAQSRQTDMLQFNFRGMINEQFTVEIALNGVSLVEKFII